MVIVLFLLLRNVGLGISYLRVGAILAIAFDERLAFFGAPFGLTNAGRARLPVAPASTNEVLHNGYLNL